MTCRILFNILYVKLALLIRDGVVMENKLKELREKAEMTQEDLAVRAGVSRQTIISLEKGKYNPSIILAYKLSRLFELTIEELFLLNESGDKE